MTENKEIQDEGKFKRKKMLSMVMRFILTFIKKFSKSETTSVNRRNRLESISVNQETDYGEEKSSE